MRYYRVDVDGSGSTSYQIGMQSREGLLGGNGAGDTYDSSYFLPFEILPVDASAQSTLQGNTITFNFTGIEDNNNTCGGLGYDLRNISTSDLRFFNSSSGALYYLRVCGVVSQPYCAATLLPQGYRPMICQADADDNGAATNFTAALAVYNPNAIYWQYLANGVRATIQRTAWCAATLWTSHVSAYSTLCATLPLSAPLSPQSSSSPLATTRSPSAPT